MYVSFVFLTFTWAGSYMRSFHFADHFRSECEDKASGAKF